MIIKEIIKINNNSCFMNIKYKQENKLLYINNNNNEINNNFLNNIKKEKVLRIYKNFINNNLLYLNTERS